jgi:hypothetical protein
MSREQFQTHAEEAKSARQERLFEQYRDAIKRYHELQQSIPEAKEILLRGLPPANDDERCVAADELQRGALESACEEYAQKGEYYAERAMRMLEQLKSAEMTIRALYFDAKSDSSELAELIVQQHPWVEYATEAANDDSFEVEKAA